MKTFQTKKENYFISSERNCRWERQSEGKELEESKIRNKFNKKKNGAISKTIQNIGKTGEICRK